MKLSIFKRALIIAVCLVWFFSLTTKAQPYTLNFKKKFDTSKLANPNALNKIDKLILTQINDGVFPGCQVIGVHKGEVIYNKQFGTLDYDINKPVKAETIYDIASISKILATTLAIMKLYEEEEIHISHYAKQYLPFIEGSNKTHLTIKGLLLHEGGLKAWIPFYKETLDEENRPLSTIYQQKPYEFYRLAVAPSLFMDVRYMNSVWQEIMNSPVGRMNYVYSDLDFYFLERIVRKVADQELDQYLNKHFYEPLALTRTLFNPWRKGLISACAPTEIDNYFRHQTIQGFVHDQGAAMLGGVAGHAGLFSNAEEVAILMQMLMNGGVYQNKRYLKEETIKEFTSYQSPKSRRGLGFDKPEKRGKDGPTSDKASSSTFGHLGFTGTVTWADPENELVYVFLSNRTYPSARNNLLARSKTRKILHDYFYEAIGL